MKKFPILKLPLLAAEEVLKQLSFRDIYPLSMCSKKSSRLIRLVHTIKYTLDIRPWMSSLFQLKVDHSHWIIPKDEEKRNSKDPTFIDNMWKELKTELSHLLTTFKFHQKSFVCAKIWTPEQNQPLLETIIRNQGNTFEDLILSRNYGDLSNQWILENIKVDNVLTTYTPFAQKGFIFKTCPKILQSFGSSWINLDTLVSLGSCKAIEANATVLLTVKEVNSFMEIWKKDRFPNLEYMYLGDIKWEPNELILGFTREQMSVRRDEMKRRKTISSKCYHCVGGVNTESDDGVNGTLYFDVTFGSVQFFVWKD